MATIDSDSAVAERGQQLGPTDLDIFFEVGAVPTNPYELLFDLYDFTTGSEVLIPPANRTPNMISTGHFYVPWYVPAGATFGEYHVRWKYRMLIADPQSTENDEFFVVAKKNLDPTLTAEETYFVDALRHYLRDTNPDRDRHFAPPLGEGDIDAFTNNKGYIWYNEDLKWCLTWGLSDINAVPPKVGTFTLGGMMDMTNPRVASLQGAFILKAAMYALDMIAIYWTGEDFAYSINGVSLDVKKGDMYRAMKEMTQTQYDKVIENYKLTVKLTKGVAPSYYQLSPGLTGSSLCGPRTSGRNIRNYIRR